MAPNEDRSNIFGALVHLSGDGQIFADAEAVSSFKPAFGTHLYTATLFVLPDEPGDNYLAAAVHGIQETVGARAILTHEQTPVTHHPGSCDFDCGGCGKWTEWTLLLEAPSRKAEKMRDVVDRAAVRQYRETREMFFRPLPQSQTQYSTSSNLTRYRGWGQVEVGEIFCWSNWRHVLPVRRRLRARLVGIAAEQNPGEAHKLAHQLLSFTHKWVDPQYSRCLNLGFERMWDAATEAIRDHNWRMVESAYLEAAPLYGFDPTEKLLRVRLLSEGWNPVKAAETANVVAESQ